MPTRTVTGKFLDPEGNPCVSQKVKFKIRPDGLEPDIDVITLKKPICVTTDSNGCISVDLWVSSNSVNNSNYTVILPSGCTYNFSIPAGVIPVDLADLIATGIIANKSLVVSASAILYDNTTSGLVAENVQEAIDEIAGGTAPGTGVYTVRVVSLGADDTLVDATSEEYQYIENLTGGNLDVDTPAAPTTGRHYFITNVSSSNSTVTVTDGGALSEVLAAGAIADIIYDGTIWRVN